MEWVLFYTDPFFMPERVIRYLPWKTQTPTIAGDGGARKQQLWRWFGWKSRFWRCDIGDLYLKNLGNNFGGACFLPSFSGTSLSDHGGSRFGDTFWGAFSCPLEISANHMGRFLATLSSWDTPQVQTKVVKQFLCEVLSSYRVVHALHYQKRTLSTLKIRKSPCFKAILVILGSRKKKHSIALFNKLWNFIHAWRFLFPEYFGSPDQSKMKPPLKGTDCLKSSQWSIASPRL